MIQHPELAASLVSIVDVMMDDMEFEPYHHKDMDEMFCVVKDTLAESLQEMVIIPSGVGVGHREVVHDFAHDPLLLTRAPALSVEDEIEPVESPYLAYGAGHHVKLQLTGAHIRSLVAIAETKKASFVLRDEFNSLSCKLKIEARESPGSATPFGQHLFAWLSAFSRRASPVLGDNIEKRMIDMNKLLVRSVAGCPVGESRERLVKAQAWFLTNQHKHDKDASALSQVPAKRGLLPEDLKHLALGDSGDVSVAIYRFGRKQGDLEGPNGPGWMVGGNFDVDGGMGTVCDRLALSNVIGMDDDGAAWVIRFAGDREALVGPVEAAKAAMLVDLARIMDVSAPSACLWVGTDYLPWEPVLLYEYAVVLNMGRFLVEG